MPDQSRHQPSQSIFELIASLENSPVDSALVDRRVEAAIDTSRAMLAESTELLAKANAALLRR